MTIRDINLLPDDTLFRSYVTRRLLFWAGWLVMVIIALAAVWIYEVRVVLEKSRPRTTLEDMHTQLGMTEEEILQTQNEIGRLKNQQTFMDNLKRSETMSVLMARLARTMNARTWLDKLEMTCEAKQKDDIPGMRISGFTHSNVDLGNFLTRLSGEPLFKDISLEYAREVNLGETMPAYDASVKAIAFRITCRFESI